MTRKTTVVGDAVRLLAALRAGGCDVFVEDDQVFCSPPSQRIEWDGDPEAEIDELHDELLILVIAATVTVH